MVKERLYRIVVSSSTHEVRRGRWVQTRRDGPGMTDWAAERYLGNPWLGVRGWSYESFQLVRTRGKLDRVIASLPMTGEFSVEIVRRRKGGGTKFPDVYATLFTRDPVTQDWESETT